MSLDPAKQTFVAESRDLLFAMEQALLKLEQVPADRDAINAVFGAAHTIKGAAGMFGFDALVDFTHALESLLERVRAGALLVDNDLIALLLACGDNVGAFIDSVAAGDDAPTTERSASLIERLRARLREIGADIIAPRRDPAVADDCGDEDAECRETQETASGDKVISDAWHISLRFGRDVLRNGMDPLSIFRYLGTLGKIVSLTTVADGLPPAEEMDPESCYLGVEIDFRSDATKRAIEGAFEFVRDDCAIRILPPHSRIGEYIELINSLPEDTKRLGELLVASGTLTPHELEIGLALQERMCAEPTLPGRRRLGEILVDQRVVQTEVVDAALEKQARRKEGGQAESNLIRVQADKLDHLINLVGELVITGASTTTLARHLRNDDLHELASTLERLVSEIRDGALRLRMVQIGETFSRFARKVRDVSRELGKDVDLTVSGADTELDKSMVDKLGDPLLHLVRNAIDHGIESAALRLERGKPAKGTVRLNAYHDSGSIVIEVADDGGGLDKDRIYQKALDAGLVTGSQSLSDQEIFALVFQAGFSTADEVTNLSGRGVGMDVVRRAIEALRGTVHIESELGVGTTVRLRLPLTLAIIDGFLVGVESASWVLPLGMVAECVELSADRQASDGRDFINLRGEVLPLLRLRDQFEMTGTRPARESVVVVESAGQRAGLVVDRLLGEFQTVIKPLARVFQNLRGISGSTILGSGEVALILDIPALVQLATERERERTAATADTV